MHRHPHQLAAAALRSACQRSCRLSRWSEGSSGVAATRTISHRKCLRQSKYRRRNSTHRLHWCRQLGLGTVMHGCRANRRPWPDCVQRRLRLTSHMMLKPQFRASFRPTLPDLLAEAEPPETGFALGVAVVAAGLVDKCLLLPISQPKRGDKSPIRLPIKEARGACCTVASAWWESTITASLC